MVVIKICSNCKSQSDLNPSMKIMINKCGHPICNYCVETIWARNSAQCRDCDKILKKHEFWEQQFDDPIIEKENYFRKRVKKVYNLKRDCFKSLEEYNDYLEKIEDLVYNLTYDIDVAETEKEIDNFAKNNADVIEQCRRKKDDDQLWIDRAINEENNSKSRLLDRIEKEKHEKALRDASKIDTKAVIDELKNSSIPADLILERKRKMQEDQDAKLQDEERKKKIEKAQKKKLREYASFTTARSLGIAYIHKLPDLHINGPAVPTIKMIQDLGYMNHVPPIEKRVAAGGYYSEIGVIKDLTTCRIDLFLF
uniref:RING-type domain-containing protein n=1 Tax=Parastrongyloides trichosuri TaxID=131310 RepID=A0A0N5A2H8_PARTI